MTGKQKCEALKRLREIIATANGIEHRPTECNFEGECPGYCGKCDSEAKYLEAELERLEAEGKEVVSKDLLKLSIMSGYAVETRDNDTADDCSSKIDPESEEIMEMPIEELDLSENVYYGLKSVEIDTVGDLVHMTADEMMDIDGFTDDSVQEIEDRLRDLWTAFHDNTPDEMGDLIIPMDYATPGIILPPTLKEEDEPDLLGDIAPDDSIFDDDDRI